MLEEGLLSDAECHIRCFAHVLNLAAEAAIAPIKSKIERLRKVVKFLRRSDQYLQKFEAECKTNGVPYNKPQIDCETRWNSMYDMLQLAIRYKEQLMSITNRIIREKATYEDKGRFSRDVC